LFRINYRLAKSLFILSEYDRNSYVALIMKAALAEKTGTTGIQK